MYAELDKHGQNCAWSFSVYVPFDLESAYAILENIPVLRL